jgi:two-component system chemotaxis response regulator CheY
MAKVLIVEDTSFARQSMRSMVEKCGYEVVAEACTGLEAIEKCKQYKPDIVTMDLIMSDMTAIDALKGIKEYDLHAKFVMVSSVGQEQLKKQAIFNGVFSFLLKPYKEEKVIEALRCLAK